MNSTPKTGKDEMSNSVTRGQELQQFQEHYSQLTGYLINQLDLIVKSSQALERMVIYHTKQLDQMKFYFALAAQSLCGSSSGSSCLPSEDHFEPQLQLDERDLAAEQLLTLQQINENQKVLINTMRCGISNLLDIAINSTTEFINFMASSLLEEQNSASENLFEDAVYLPKQLFMSPSAQSELTLLSRPEAIAQDVAVGGTDKGDEPDESCYEIAVDQPLCIGDTWNNNRTELEDENIRQDIAYSNEIATSSCSQDVN